MLRWFFTVVYCLVFLYLINAVFKHTINPITDLLAMLFFVIAFIASVILADYTIKKIKEKYSKK